MHGNRGTNKLKLKFKKIYIYIKKKHVAREQGNKYIVIEIEIKKLKKIYIKN